MGLSNRVDFVTGLAIGERERAVAVVIERRTGGYPDAEKAAAAPAVHPTDMFEMLSLPVRGTMDGYGGLEPDSGQASVDMVVAMADKTCWEDFARHAFDFGEGVAFRPDRMERLFSKDAPVKDRPRVVLGTAFARESTWARLVDEYGRHSPRAEAVSATMAAMAFLRTTQRTDVSVYDQIMLSALGTSRLGSDPARDLPSLTRALGGDAGVSARVARFLSDDARWHKAVFEGEDDAYLAEILGGIWDLVSARNGLRYAGRLLVPSPHVGQHDNAQEAADIAASTLGDVVARLGDLADLEVDDAAKRLEALERLARAQEEVLRRTNAAIAAVAAYAATVDDEECRGPAF